MSASDQNGEMRPALWRALTHGRTLFSIIMFSIFFVMVIVAWGYSWPANFLPFVIGIPGMALAFLQVILDIRGFIIAKGKIDPRTEFEIYMAELTSHTEGLELEVVKEKAETLVEDHSLVAKSRNRQEMTLFGFFFFLLGIVLLFGFWIGTPIFLFLFLRYYAKEPLILSLMITAGVWSVMYFILVIVLSQIIFEGYITNFIYDTYIAD
ncbi:MAG: hypothetical protein O7F14_05935 [Alphaproteobacteria bacterium]|nr:hypothetical protein [Alphaproteobacteria bacterium]